MLAEFLDGNAFDKKAAQWEFYAKSSRIFSLYLRPIFTTVTFEYYKDNSHIMELIDLLKLHYVSGKNPSTLKIGDDLGDRRHLSDGGRFEQALHQAAFGSYEPIACLAHVRAFLICPTSFFPTTISEMR